MKTNQQILSEAETDLIEANRRYYDSLRKSQDLTLPMAKRLIYKQLTG